MLDKINPTRTAAWRKLKAHHKFMKQTHTASMFREDPGRFSRFSFTFEDILVDCSKNILNEETLRLLLDLAAECSVRDAVERMFLEQSTRMSSNVKENRENLPK
ncbi:MAG: glucose-6-phosphate isomerase, partial [Syntrophobacteraceae bacterium]|nr:glucose-6-phosphate isomerase [Syntrophobacteraceae bacterium]